MWTVHLLLIFLVVFFLCVFVNIHLHWKHYSEKAEISAYSVLANQGHVSNHS